MNGLGAGSTIDPSEPTVLRLSGGQSMRFVEPRSNDKTGVVGVDLWAAPGGDRTFDSIDFCGVTWKLVEPAEE